MPNTKPVCSSAEIVHEVEEKAREIGLCDANQTVSITKNFDGHTIDHLLDLPDDIKFITEDGNGVMNNATMARVFAVAAERGLTVMSHAEDREISPWDYRLAENIETVRNATWPNITALACICAMFPPKNLWIWCARAAAAVQWSAAK